MRGYSTRAIHAGSKEQGTYPGPSYPIYMSSTFNQDSIDEFSEFMYTRSSNPTRSNLEAQVAALEECKYALATSSGMAAIATALSFLCPGDKILINNNIYGGTWTYVSEFLKDKSIDYEVVDDFNAYDFDKVEANVKAVFVETPSNPLLTIVDIEKVAKQVKDKDITLIVDNTFMTSYLQKPLQLGADIVVCSATKLYGGHSDLIAGLISTNSQAFYDQFKLQRKLYGASLAPFDAFLLNRGIKTMPIRIDRQELNAQKVAEFLKDHPAVDKLYYAGSKENPNYSVQEKQAKGFGSVLSFELSDKYDVKIFAESLEVFDLAVSLGGVESLICLPAKMTHEEYPEELLNSIGITDSLFRLAIGIEDSEDLIEDLEQAFRKAKK